jgi:hypothetical protein
MFYIIYKKFDKTVLFTKFDNSSGWSNSAEVIFNQICEDRHVNSADYVIEETVKLDGIRTDGSQIYDSATKTLSDNPAYVPPPVIETASLPVTDISQGAQ